MKEYEISKLNPCHKALEFRKEFSTFKEAWDNCPRGDWMLWLASRLDIDLLKLTTAKAHCANTVRHLMKDEHSKRAIDVTLLFGKGKATIEELKTAANTAHVAYINATTNTAAAAYTAYVAATYVANANAADDAADANAVAYVAATTYSKAVYATTYTAYTVDNAAANTKAANTYATAKAETARKENQLKTANICRNILTTTVFKKLNIL